MAGLVRSCAPAVLPVAAGAVSGPMEDLDAAERAAAEWAALASVVAGGGPAGGRVRVSRDGGRSYPRSCERALTAQLPVGQPAAVRVYDDNGDARCLSVDLDVARGGQEQVDRDTDHLLGLVARCGGRTFCDRSPTGGRHVYLPLALPVPYSQLRPVLYALAALLPSVDVAPGVNLLAGCIRPPGARHKTGGWQRLDGPLSAAQDLARAPNPPAVWAALCAALRPQLSRQLLRAAQPTQELPADAAGAAGPRERQGVTEPAARSGGPRPLRPAVLATARTGVYDTARYPSPSEARQSVLAAAAASGWTLPDVLEQLHAGHWPGLWQFYARYPDRHRREALAGDWLNALTYARTPPPSRQQQGHVHNPDTREPPTHRGVGGSSPKVTMQGPPAVDESGLPVDGHQFVRAWWNAVRLAERDRHTGRGGQGARLVLRAIGNAAQKTGRRHLAFGVRSLAIAAGLSRTTVAVQLRVLRDARDPLIVLLVQGRGLAGDLYQLRVPDAYLERARTDAWRPGRIDALLPCFRSIGAPAAFVYETLDAQPQSSWDLAAAALLSTRAGQQALTELAVHGLATRDRDGWRRGHADPDEVARALGADQLVAEQARRYRTERASWQTRLGALSGPTVRELLHTPPGPAEPDREEQFWLPQQAQPPPSAGVTPSVQYQALRLVLQTLGGTVLHS